MNNGLTGWSLLGLGGKMKLKTLWSKKEGNHTYVLWRGKPIYKRWDNSNHPSVIFQKWGLTDWIRRKDVRKKSNTN